LNSEAARIEDLSSPIAARRGIWLFWVAVALFLGATLIDTGRSWSRIAGESPGSIATVFLMFLGWVNVRRRKLGVVGLAMLGVVVVAAAQVLFRGESPVGAYRLVGPLAMAWILASQRADERFIATILQFTLALASVLCVSFYLGIWRDEHGTMSFPSLNRNIVALELVAGAASALYLGRNGYLGRVMRWAWPFVMVAFAVPVLFTASRKGAIAFAVIPVVYFSLARKSFQLARAAVALAVIAGVAMFATEETEEGGGAEQVETLVYRFEAGDALRQNLRDLAVDTIGLEPLAGHGISTVELEAWKIAHGFVHPTGEPISVHNGFLTFGLKGGWPLMGLYILMLVAASARLIWLSATAQSKNERELCATGLVLFSIQVISLLTAGSSEYWKFGWYLIGVVLLIGDVVKPARQELPAGNVREAVAT
jgi:hypothetical protein